MAAGHRWTVPSRSAPTPRSQARTLSASPKELRHFLHFFTVLLALWHPPLASGCEFHCNRSLCGDGSPVSVDQTNFVSLGWGLGFNGEPVGGALDIRALNLSHRNITSLAPDAFSCYTFASSYPGPHAPPSTQPQGIDLSYNQIVELPNISVFLVTSVVSLEHNLIERLDPGVFAAVANTVVFSLSLAYNPRLATIDPGILGTSPTAGTVFFTLILAHCGFVGPLPNGLFASSFTIMAWDLSHNAITSIPADLFGNGGAVRHHEITLSLAHNLITAIPENLFYFANKEEMYVDLGYNLITALGNRSFVTNASSYLAVDASNNAIRELNQAMFDVFTPTNRFGTQFSLSLAYSEITSLPEAPLALFRGGYIFLNLSHCPITTLPIQAFKAVEYVSFIETSVTMDMSGCNVSTLGPEAFDGTTAYELAIDLSGNGLHTIVNGTFSGLRGTALTMFLGHNNLTSLPFGLFSGLAPLSMLVNFEYNGMRSLNEIFHGFSGEAVATFNFANNFLQGDDLAVAVEFYTAAAVLTLDLSKNNVTSLPNNMLGQPSTVVSLRLILNLSENPIAWIGRGAFAPSGSRTVSLMEISLDHPTSGMPVQFDNSTAVSYEGVQWDSQGGVLNISLVGTQVSLDVVQWLSTGLNPPITLAINISSNGYRVLPPGVFATSAATALSLRNNSLSEIQPSVFAYNFYLQELDLGDNSVTLLSVGTVSRLPALRRLNLEGNSVLAVPTESNHIATQTDLAHNVLTCGAYGPTTANCWCNSPGLAASVHCGYARCLPANLTNGCPVDTFFDSANCSLAPWSVCVTPVEAESYLSTHYYDPATKTFLAIDPSCDLIFKQSTGQYLQGFEFAAPTLTTNRQCSICSRCPSGFDTVPCTPTTNTQCVQHSTLTPAAIAAIACGVLIPFIGLLVALLYIRAQSARTELGQTKNYLELTEQLLGTEREEIEQMKQAWAIQEADLAFGGLIGQGAFGRVYQGTWGHIPVAIKVLRYPLEELDKTMRADFDREVKFMRSIRHPHVLTFYGAGVDKDQRAFLVTELMGQGSLKRLLQKSGVIEWPTKLTFALDIAKGMAYLHEKGTVHRDLKADNCFVGDDGRVKVADFGTGRIAARIGEKEWGLDAANLNPTAPPGGGNRGRTLSKGVGSLLWMAPEVLSGARIREGQGSALDVYSYAIVLWEIWGQTQPWNEIPDQGVGFTVALTEAVQGGSRPALPSSCGTAPRGYEELMERCWAGQPEARPPFSAVVTTLTTICQPRPPGASESAL